MKTIHAMTKKEYIEYLISVFERNKLINDYCNNHLKPYINI
mgnify:CR=1 FL=1